VRCVGFHCSNLVLDTELLALEVLDQWIVGPRPLLLLLDNQVKFPVTLSKGCDPFLDAH
jgi:hypothetical protein